MTSENSIVDDMCCFSPRYLVHDSTEAKVGRQMVKLEGEEKRTNIKRKRKKKMLGFWPMARNVKYNRKLINLKA